jgi:hypothetical protein
MERPDRLLDFQAAMIAAAGKLGMSLFVKGAPRRELFGRRRALTGASKPDVLAGYLFVPLSQ